jgi:enoyl-CoA hydratase/carnithine racemase
VLSALECSRIPTIAAIAGACTGGAATIAACCDLRIGAENARFGIPIAPSAIASRCRTTPGWRLSWVRRA